MVEFRNRKSLIFRYRTRSNGNMSGAMKRLLWASTRTLFPPNRGLASRADIVVVGASVMDLIAYVPRFPAVGETLHGNDFQTGYGGKGANQAVAASKLGSSVAMVSVLHRSYSYAVNLDNRCHASVRTLTAPPP